MPGGVACPKPRPAEIDRRDTKRTALDHYFDERKKAFARDEGCCVVCGKLATETHHIILRSKGGPDDAWNLASVCADRLTGGCHRLATRNVIKMRGNANLFRGPDKLVIEMWKSGPDRWVPVPRFRP
jgi:5-methylcytosine-specific restriction endonuclease McrA